MLECKNCKQLREENLYLRTLVDRLLEKVGVAPVDPAVPVGTQAFQHEAQGLEEGLPQDRIGI